MNSRIAMDLAQAERTVAALRQQHAELDQALGALAASVADARSAWHGAAEVRFGAAWEEWLRSAREILATVPPLAEGIEREKNELERAAAALG